MIEITGTIGQSTSVELYLWNDPSSIPSLATYTLSKDLVTTSAWYDVSPYCREYIAHSGYTEISSGESAAPVTEYCYLTTKTYKDGVLQATSEYICFDGFGYHVDGYNPTVDKVLLDEGEYYVKEDSNSGGVFVFDDGTGTWTATYTGLTTGGTTNQNITNTVGYIPMLLNTYASEGNLLEIKRNAVVQKTFTFTTECEAKYTPVECDFKNRYGVWQRLIFFKAKKENFEVRGVEYKMHPSSPNYNDTDNIMQEFNKNASERITCNTGWVREGYSEVIKQLLLSDRVILDGVAVKPITNSVELFSHLNNNNINYQIEFMHTHDELNYVI
jgi:hypothetical protein